MRQYRSLTPTRQQRVLIKKWIARLRDPESKQATGRLRRGQGFCCLGHLCVVAGVEPLLRKEAMLAKNRDGWGGGHGYPPESVTSQLDKNGQDRVYQVYIGGRLHHLTQLNDTFRFTLSEIADVIEADWLKGKPLTAHPTIFKKLLSHG